MQPTAAKPPLDSPSLVLTPHSKLWAQLKLSLSSAVFLSGAVHGLAAAGLSALASAPPRSSLETRAPIFVEVAALDAAPAVAVVPPVEPASAIAPPPRAAKPRVSEPAPAPKPRAAVPAPTPVEVPPPEPALAPEPTPPAEPVVPEVAVAGAPTAVASAPAGANGLGASVGTAAGVGGVPGSGAGAATGTRPGQSDPERLLARKKYVHSLEDLIRAHTRYPRAAARNGLQGRVVLALRVARDGALAGLRVATSSAHDILDDAALEAAREIGRLPAPPALAALSSSDEVLVGVVYVVR
jgi:protein TonB